MKNWKHCAIIGILAIIVFGVVFNACDDGKLCDCNPKVHNGTCPCSGKDCDCMEQVGTLVMNDGFNAPIRKEKGISVGDMSSAVTIIQEAYSENTNNLDGKITAIHVTRTGKIWRYDSNKVLWIKLGEVNAYVMALFDSIRDGRNPGTESNE